MEEYDKMLAGEYNFPFKDGVPNKRMSKLREKARIDLETFNAIPKSEFEARLTFLKSITKKCDKAFINSPVT